MLPYYDLRRRIEIGLLGLLASVAILYGLFRAYPLVAGPSITIFSPQNGDYVASTTFEISGQVKRANVISIQGKPITIDTAGYFTETLVAHAPYTILVIVAKDAYGESVTKTIRVLPQ